MTYLCIIIWVPFIYSPSSSDRFSKNPDGQDREQSKDGGSLLGKNLCGKNLTAPAHREMSRQYKAAFIMYPMLPETMVHVPDENMLVTMIVGIHNGERQKRL